MDEEDEDEEDSDGDDGSRFDVRPQFEGPAGQKLMELQSRFRTDERFRMDARFLEDDQDKKGEEGEALRRKETRLWKRRRRRTCPSCRGSWAAASTAAPAQQLARPGRSGMFLLCTTTPPERSTRRWRPGPLATRRGGSSRAHGPHGPHGPHTSCDFITLQLRNVTSV
ncbi:unnamed protein product [Tetraodon nigroviridis]|uniref:(spotted green pufferfish) hypothetical protein n=1 Tax=Tetraodon nigroviridis TaxID=99883 RepID=Q4TEU0_TETNG|nr:unnamed protein product [Tetraodon nigroviridis]